MTVKELIKKLQNVPQEAEVYVEGSSEIGLSIEGYDKDRKPLKDYYVQIIRLFRPWDIDDMICPMKDLVYDKGQKNDY